MTTISETLRAGVSNHDGEPFACDVRVAWTSERPFELSWTFLDTTVGDIEWTLSRELIAESLITYDRLGIGDVRVQRFVNACAVKLELSSPSGQCEALMCTTPLTTFLNATYRMCPPNSAVESEAVEHALAVLLAQVNR